jgi:hypothetical protein
MFGRDDVAHFDLKGHIILICSLFDRISGRDPFKYLIFQSFDDPCSRGPWVESRVKNPKILKESFKKESKRIPGQKCKLPFPSSGLFDGDSTHCEISNMSIQY